MRPEPAARTSLSLQRRLTDAGCYNGAIDGAPSAALDAAVKACPDQAPFLRIETGMHTAVIRRIGVDAACRRIATASDDKTVRLWSLPDGKLERTIRLPIGPGNDGKLNAVALSPDGRRLAAGGTHSAYAKLGSSSLSLVDLDSGSIRRVGSFPDVIDSIGFSPDGARVAVGLDAQRHSRLRLDVGRGIVRRSRLCRRSLWPCLRAGRLPDREQLGWTVAPLRTGSAPVRQTRQAWRASSRMESRLIPPAGAWRSASTMRRKSRSSTRLLWRRSPRRTPADRDGQSRLRMSLGLAMAACSWREATRTSNRAGSIFCAISIRTDGAAVADIPISSNTVMDIRPCGDGFAYAASDPAFGLASAGGLVKVLQGPRTADMRNKFGKGLEISGDGAIVRFGLGNGDDKPVLFDVAAGSLANSPSAPAGLAPARVDGLPVTDWKNSYEPKFKGVKIGLDNHEMARSLAVRPDGSGFALGTEWHVRAFDAAGKSDMETGWLRAQPGASTSARTARSSSSPMATARSAGCGGRTAWSCSRCSSTFRPAAGSPGRRPAITWPRPGGEDLIGWHLNRGWTQEADFFPASRFSARFNRPDIVQLVLKTHDEAEAVDQANEKAKRKQDTAPIETTLPPVIKIVSPTADGKFSGDAVEVMFTVRSPSGLPIDRVDALIDGRPVEARGVAPAASQSGDSSANAHRSPGAGA